MLKKKKQHIDISRTETSWRKDFEFVRCAKQKCKSFSKKKKTEIVSTQYKKTIQKTRKIHHRSSKFRTKFKLQEIMTKQNTSKTR